MVDYDEQISKNIEEVDKIHQEYKELAAALNIISKTSNRNYGVSIRLSPKRGIYCIEDGWIKPLDLVYEEAKGTCIDDIKGLKLIDKVEGKGKNLKIIYENGTVLIID
ncbi:hypothetical protein JCM16358_17900 [Halanaerocella petrolearia]